MSNNPIYIIGAGLAGSEAAWQAAQAGCKVILHEMRTKDRKTFAHQTDNFAELVCSNSFRSDDDSRSAIGQLHWEMRQMNSLIIAMADKHKVPAGGALAMDREAFSQAVTAALESHPNITIKREEITKLPQDNSHQVIIATGPLTSDSLADEILKETSEEYLSFYDAIAPIVTTESIDMSKAWFQSRYDKGDAKDYINCPMDKEQYESFITALIESDKTEFKEWEKDTPYFEGCLPIEVMAGRGVETLRFGPMKPVGLTNPHNPTEKAYAIIQLRQDNKQDTMRNIVGFQTKMKYGEQTNVLRKIPGLENAEFVRLGGIHRNTFINSPILLDNTARLKSKPYIRFAGQITGVEGYVESATCGLLCGKFAASDNQKTTITSPPRNTSMGALLSHITGEANDKTFQPMNVNFSLYQPLKERVHKKVRKEAYTTRAKQEFLEWNK